MYKWTIVIFVVISFLGCQTGADSDITASKSELTQKVYIDTAGNKEIYFIDSNGFREGSVVIYDKFGVLRLEGQYANDSVIGFFSFYDSYGKMVLQKDMISDSTRAGGLLTNQLIEYDSTGNIIYQSSFFVKVNNSLSDTISDGTNLLTFRPFVMGNHYDSVVTTLSIVYPTCIKDTAFTSSAGDYTFQVPHTGASPKGIRIRYKFYRRVRDNFFWSMTILQNKIFK